MRTRWLLSVAAATVLTPFLAVAQTGESPANTPNMHVLGRLRTDGPAISYTDIEIEQEPGRPYAYLSRIIRPTFGFDVVSLADPGNPTLLYSWRIENPELHLGLGAMDAKYFKHDGRYYIIQSFQFSPGGPDADLGAIVFDVTDLPDPTTVREVARIRAPETPGGFHNIFAYKHSSGRPLLFTTTSGRHANVYDLASVVAGDTASSLVGRVPWPATAPDLTPYGPLEGYHDFYAAYDPGTGQDKLYGSGYNGYYIYDVTDPAAPELVTSVVGVLGLQIAHTFSASPDGRIAVGQTEYQYSPVKIYDLGPALDGKVQTVSEEIAAWSENWAGLSHNHEMRWPYVFVSAYRDGIQVFDIQNPREPKTVGLFDTYEGDPHAGIDPTQPEGLGMSPWNGAFGIDVRNYDGLIVASDAMTGLWVVRMDGFDGWDGAKWHVPNISSVQDWDRGPKRMTP